MTTLSTSIAYDHSSSLILMTLRGSVCAQGVIETYKRAKEYSSNYESYKVLVDVTELKHDFAAIDLVTFMPQVAHALKDINLARVVSYDGYMHDLFLQKAKRFGVKVENFECFQTAKQWLSKAT